MIAVIKPILLLCEIVRSDMKLSSDGGIIKQIIHILFACLQSIVQFIQKYLGFLTSRTYVLISIKGGSFYSTAKQTLYLLLRHLLHSVVLENVIEFVFFIAQALIIAFASFFLILVRIDIFLLLLGIVFIIFAVFILFDSFYYTVITLFIDFLIDEEMVHSHPDDSDYHSSASPELTKHMDDIARMGYSMAQKYKDTHSDFNLAFYVEQPPQYNTAPSTSSQPPDNLQTQTDTVSSTVDDLLLPLPENEY